MKGRSTKILVSFGVLVALGLAAPQTLKQKLVQQGANNLAQTAVETELGVEGCPTDDCPIRDFPPVKLPDCDCCFS